MQLQGVNLAKLWLAPAPTLAAVPGRRAGGRPPKSGREVIAAAAAAITVAATTKPNIAAEALGLGPCLIGKGIGSRGEGGRPRKQLTGGVGEGGKRKQFAAMEYHITWCASAGQAPPGVPGLGWSHRCHQAACVEPRHGLWEPWKKNRARDQCTEEGAGSCPHIPVCVPSG